MEVGASKIKKFKRALRRDPSSAEANLGLALVYFKRGELVEALPYAEKASQTDPASADAKALLGSIYMVLDRDAKAEECLAEAVRLNAGAYDSYSRLAEVRYRRSDIAGAIKVLEDASELFPRNSQVFNDLGVMYYLRGDVTEAEKQFIGAREVDPKDRDALFNLSVICLDRGKVDGAVEVLEKLIAIEPDRAAHYVNLGRAHQAGGNPGAARECFEKAVALNPDDVEAHYGLGVSLFQLGHRDAAPGCLERCLELDPEHGGATLAMIGCLAHDGRTDEIVKLWEKRVALTDRAKKGRGTLQPRLSAGRDVVPVEVLEKIHRRVSELAEEKVDLSVVVPVVEESERIRSFQDELTEALESAGKQYAILYVADGGHETTLRVLRTINECDDRVKVVSLARAYGHAASLSAGFDHARGDVIVAVDSPLRSDPRGIGTLLEKVTEGYDVVVGVPEGRTGTSFGRRVRTWIANCVTVAVAGIRVGEAQSGLAAYRRSVLDSLKGSAGVPQFVLAIAETLGCSTARVPVRHKQDPDAEADRNTSFAAPYGVLDLIIARFLTDSRTGPMRYFGRLALCSLVIGAILSVLVAVWVLLSDRGWAWIGLPVVLFAALAALMVATGFLAEMVIRTYRHGHSKPTYVVRELIE